MVFSQEVIDVHASTVGHLKNAYAPYSKLNVGCGLKLKGQSQAIFGVNVENASYGGTICAERSALVSMVSQFGKSEVEFIIVVSNIKGGPIPPCGLCLQFLNELVSRSCPIYLGNESTLLKMHTLEEFLPLAFSPEMLPS